MSELCGTITVKVSLDDDLVHEETVLNETPSVDFIAKSLGIDVFGRAHKIDVEFHFDPPVLQELAPEGD